MMDKLLTTFVLGNKNIEIIAEDEVEIILYKDIQDIYKAKGKYITFINIEDSIDTNYFNIILDKIRNSLFDLCFINYQINYNYKRKLKVRHDFNDLSNNLVHNNSYIWNYVYLKEDLIKLIENPNILDNVEKIKNLFKKREVISEVIYYHNRDGLRLNILGLVNRRNHVYYKNIIYMGEFCNGLFNGYITWLNEIGKAFDFDITIIYTKINEDTLNHFKERFKCVEYDSKIDYVCDNLVTTYSTYFYPINIYSLNENSIFIHGNMSDYEHSARFSDDIYDRYIAVSKVARDRANGYFPTNNIEYIYNPYTYDKSKIKAHLKLITACRNAPEKGIERVKIFASILDDLDIPYTWEVFTDVVEENRNGLIFRHCVTNTIDYIMDADYLVQFSRSEALSYSLTEALCANVKVITTDIPAIHELGIVDGVNGIVIPLNYFDNNYDLLKNKVLEAYKYRDKSFSYSYDKERFIDYLDIFGK